MKEINLKLSVDQVNIILEGLGNMPFSKVYTLIQSIQEQAAQQMQGQENPNGQARKEAE